MTYAEAIKFCEGYLPECDTKIFVIEKLTESAKIDAIRCRNCNHAYAKVLNDEKFVICEVHNQMVLENDRCSYWEGAKK